MLRRFSTGLISLSLCSSSFAGVAITVVPSVPDPPGGFYPYPGQQLNMDILAQLTPGTPSVPGPGGSTSSIRVRMMQFDLSDTDPALDVRPYGHEIGGEFIIPFWDFSGALGCSADPFSCGTNYFIDGNISSDDLLNITYTGLVSSNSLMITLNQSVPKKVGELVVALPGSLGVYTLDLLNADEADINEGAEIRWGFGSDADPTDLTSPLRANTGGITGGQFRFYLCQGDPNCIPEPGMLALLGLGGLVITIRRYS